MRHVVLDIETRHLATDPEVGGWSQFHFCGVACAVVYCFQTRRFKVFGHTPPELLELRQELERADRISGFNIRRFDLPVIYETPKRLATPVDAKVDDLFERVLRARGVDPDGSPSGFKGWGLDPICKGTLGVGKIMDGKDAPKLFQSHRFSELHTYCLDDVSLERDLCHFIEMHGFVINSNSNEVLRVPPWSPPAKLEG